MRDVTLQGLNLGDLMSAVGPGGYSRGVTYFHQQRVASAWWDEDQSALCGTVRGQSSECYSTMAYFTFPDDGRPQFEHGRCTCPVGINCKHVVALIFTGIGDQLTAGHREPEPPTWESSLESLLDSSSAVARPTTGKIPIALELSLGAADRRDGPPKLFARLVQQGRSGGWISGSLSWGKLDSLHYHGGYLMPQVRLLQELFAIYSSRASSWVRYGDLRSVDLSAFESSQLWPMLDQAPAAGLRLVYPRKLGDIPAYRPAEVCLDLTGIDTVSPLVIAPVIRIDGELAEVTPLRFIGGEGHGLVYVEGADAAQAAGPDGAQRGGDPSGWRFRLAQLAKPVPAQVQQMALAGGRLEVPAAERARFRDEYYPRLRQAAILISSDASFAAPEISGPELVLRAAYGDGHDLDLSWSWRYQVGDSVLRTPAGADPAEAGHRDRDAERLLLAGLDLPLDRFGLLRPGPVGADPDQLLVPAIRLTGFNTMMFSTELLPLAVQHPSVRVEVTGAPADYRAADDSLRISLSTEEVTGDTDWFDLSVTITAEGHQIPFAEVFLALSCGETHLLLDDGAYISLDKPELQVLAKLIAEARALADAPSDGLRISRFQAGLWDELTEIGVVSRQASSWQAQVQGLLSLDAVGHAEPPAGLAGQLRPYQLTGFQWLAFLWRYRLGGILADDMGLGKTLQSLALISHARQDDPGLPPFLIVAPTSVVPNWAAESARFTPELSVVSVTETTARRGQPLAELIAGADVVVTSYALLRIDFDAYAAAYDGAGWSGLILDEAQFAKNHQSKIYQCARRLPASFKLAITGTPMENNLMELWSLLSITAPGLFPNPERFREYYARPIERGGQAELLAQLRRRIKPLVKRRTKELVAPELPAKQEQVLEVELHPRHRKVYQTHLQRERQKVLGLINDLNANRFTILRSLTLLRQLSLHAGFADDAHWDVPCAKLSALSEQLRDVIGSGHRALVFSQFTSFLRLVAGALDADDVPYSYLDGHTRNRATVLREFREGTAPVFLISLKAGGFGLNLTEADYVFLLDPWWNPATEAQAVDRTHRIGQTRNVMVYRLIAAGTIEEKVMALKERKAELFSSVIDSGDTFGSTLSADDIRGLFT